MHIHFFFMIICHSERSEESRVHKVGVTEILRYALDDKMIGNFYYDTPSSFLYRYHTFDMWMRTIIHQFKVFVLEVEDVLYIRVNLHLRKRARLAGEL